MAAETPGWDVYAEEAREEERLWGDPATPQEISEALARAPKPNRPMKVDVREAEFWRTRYVPPGSVIAFRDPENESPLAPIAAVLVTETLSLPNGLWLHVRSLGAQTTDEKKKVDKYFKNHRRRIHICNLKERVCPEKDVDAFHLWEFEWFPPGDFEAEWLTGHAKKLVREGVAMAARAVELEAGHFGPPRTTSEGAGGATGPSTIEKRLSAWRGRGDVQDSRRVAFDPAMVKGSTSRVAGDRQAVLGGIGGGAAPSFPPQPPALADVKKEVLEITSDRESEEERAKKRRKSRTLADTLARAARVRNVVEERSEKNKKKKKRRRSRSRSRKGSSKKKRRHSSDSDSEEETEEESSSSEGSLMAPLKRRSLRHPGSVFKMLEEHAVERLAVDGVVDEGYEASGLRGQRPKILTYFQLVLRPQLDPKSRDCKELALLSRSLDLLRDGRLAELADVLSARLFAVDTAGRQGWQTARHLEVFCEEDQTGAPAHVLLSAQKHQRQVEKAGGKGSWGPQSSWQGNDWGAENRQKGKGKESKGKGKKGKGKGKWQKGSWQYGGADPKAKNEKPKKDDVET